MLGDDASLLPRAATMWGVLATYAPSVTPAARYAGLSALQAVAGINQAADVRALRVQARHDGLFEIASALDAWLARTEA